MDKLYSIIVCLLLIFAFYKIAIIKFFQEFKSISKLKKNGAKANGKIISVKEVIDLDNLKTYCPEIEFKTLEGKIFTFFQLDSQMKKPELNSYVEVIYDKENPRIAVINDKISRNFVKVKLFIVIFVTIFLLIILIKNLV